MSRTIAYVRVSTDKQDHANQRFEVERYATSHDLTIDEVVEETISGKRDISDRELGTLLTSLARGDTLIVSEVSRLSRRLMDVLNIIESCIANGIEVISVKENYHFTDDINSKVIAFAFGLAAEIERNLISQRTKEALARKKAEGVKLGRPTGTYHDHHRKLHEHEDDVRRLVRGGVSLAAIGRLYQVNRETVRRFVEDRNLRDIQTGV